MKINYTLDKDNKITSWAAVPLDLSQPMIEVANPDTIYLNCDKVIDGQLVIDLNGHAIIDQNKATRQNKVYRIWELKQFLNSTDYQAIKYLEGHLSKIEYDMVDKQRESARAEINQLEQELK